MYELNGQVNTKTRWNSKVHGKMTESVIRLLHGAPKRARVSVYRYARGDEVEGLSRPATFYIMSGSFELLSNGISVELVAGDVLDFSGGKYLLRISEAAPAEYIWVWDFPEGFVPDA